MPLEPLLEPDASLLDALFLLLEVDLLPLVPALLDEVFDFDTLLEELFLLLVDKLLPILLALLLEWVFDLDVLLKLLVPSDPEPHPAEVPLTLFFELLDELLGVLLPEDLVFNPEAFPLEVWLDDLLPCLLELLLLPCLLCLLLDFGLLESFDFDDKLTSLPELPALLTAVASVEPSLDFVPDIAEGFALAPLLLPPLAFKLFDLLHDSAVPLAPLLDLIKTAFEPDSYFVITSLTSTLAVSGAGCD